MKAECGDNRFEIIEKAKQELLEATNIKDRPAEMAELDSFLFRAWQMGWLKKYDDTISKNYYLDMEKAKDSHFPIPENKGRDHESACGAAGFEFGANWAYDYMRSK